MELDALLQNLEPISFQEMEGVRLMNRVDTKYLTTLPVLEKLILLLGDDFLVQEIDGRRISEYNTLYYDTPDVRMYYEHQRGRKSRRKIRTRIYVGSDQAPFLEIKNKNNKGRTRKKRIAMEDGRELELYENFITDHSEFNSAYLEPRLENKFRRITIVNKERTERITIDTSVEFHNFVTDRDMSLPRLVIIEWKRDGRAAGSKLKPLLNRLRIKESGFSKYIIGMALTDSGLPHNRIKPRLRRIEKLLNGRF